MKKRLALTLLLLAPAAHAAGDVVDVLQESGFSSFSSAVTRSGLADTLRSPGPITVFAPSEAAFAAMPPEQRALLMENKAELRAFVLRHVINGTIPSGPSAAAMESMSAEPVRIDHTGGALTADGLAVKAPPIKASNGVIYSLSAALPPQSPGTGLP